MTLGCHNLSFSLDMVLPHACPGTVLSVIFSYEKLKLQDFQECSMLGFGKLLGFLVDLYDVIVSSSTSSARRHLYLSFDRNVMHIHGPLSVFGLLLVFSTTLFSSHALYHRLGFGNAV